MNRLILSAILSLSAFVSYAQNWADAEIKMANTAVHANYLSDDEKGIILYMNLIRLNGQKFYDTFLQDYINQYNANVKKYRNYNELKITRNNPYYISLSKNLQNIKSLPLFYPSTKLSFLSKAHAMDLNQNNLESHNSSNGDKFSKRLSKYFPNTTMSENIDFGYSKSLDIVCHLLLDFGVPSLGHRNNILDQKHKLNVVGVSIQPHPTYSWCAVIDFISQPILNVNDQ